MDTLPPIKTVAELQCHLRAAVALELSTIPVYLCGYWSIQNGANPCAREIWRVIMDEMRHMTIAANCLIATGGTPDIVAGAPQYPSYLPDGEEEFEAHLLPFGKDFLEQGMAIERPAWAEEVPADAPARTWKRGHIRRSHRTLAMGKSYRTIGEFYRNVLRGIADLSRTLGDAGVFPDGGNTDKQVDKWSAIVSDCASAGRLLSNVIEEGEGAAVGNLWDENGNLAHYYVFQEMALGKAYQHGDAPGVPTGPCLAVPRASDVYQMMRDPETKDYPAGSKVSRDALRFNVDYTTVICLLDSAFGGKPADIGAAIDRMGTLTTDASTVLGDSIPDRPGAVPGPTFALPR